MSNLATIRAALTVALLLPLACAAVEFTGKVVAIADGDTLTLLVDKTQHRIRIDGIDAPERTQPYSQKAGRALAVLAAGKQATATCSKTDRYGRQVCRVIVEGKDVALEQLHAGLAWFFRRYADELPPVRRAQYEAAEAEAKAAVRGLWRDPNPQPPWDFRAAKREAVQP
jgi:endonuclease YncB( thermonuclease family)